MGAAEVLWMMSGRCRGGSYYGNKGYQPLTNHPPSHSPYPDEGAVISHRTAAPSPPQCLTSSTAQTLAKQIGDQQSTAS